MEDVTWTCAFRALMTRLGNNNRNRFPHLRDDTTNGYTRYGSGLKNLDEDNNNGKGTNLQLQVQAMKRNRTNDSVGKYMFT